MREVGAFEAKNKFGQLLFEVTSWQPGDDRVMSRLLERVRYW